MRDTLPEIQNSEFVVEKLNLAYIPRGRKLDSSVN